MSEIELVKRLRGIADHEEKLSRIVKLRDEEIADVRMGAAAIEALVSALEWAIKDIDRNTCQHDDTHRAGVIWTICDSCGAKWADDEGGFQPYREKPELTAARAALRKVRP